MPEADTLSETESVSARKPRGLLTGELLTDKRKYDIVMLEKQIQSDMVAAMKAKETVRLAALRGIKAEILLAKTSEGGTGEVTDADIIKIIRKLVKQRKESAEIYAGQNRQDLADNELAEAAAMEVYLPAQKSEAEIEAELRKIIEETGAKNPADMGRVMGVAMKRLAGEADGKLISALVKKLLG